MSDAQFKKEKLICFGQRSEKSLSTFSNCDRIGFLKKTSFQTQRISVLQSHTASSPWIGFNRKLKAVQSHKVNLILSSNLNTRKLLTLPENAVNLGELIGTFHNSILIVLSKSYIMHVVNNLCLSYFFQSPLVLLQAILENRQPQLTCTMCKLKSKYTCTKKTVICIYHSR